MLCTVKPVLGNLAFLDSQIYQLYFKHAGKRKTIPNIQTDRQKDRKTERQTDRQTDSQTDRQTDTDRQIRKLK